MKLDVGDENAWMDLPEDVRAILSLFSDDYLLSCGRRQEASTMDGYSYYDFFGRNNGNRVGIFTQEISHTGVSKPRFVSWVRAGMPDGYTGNNSWTRED